MVQIDILYFLLILLDVVFETKLHTDIMEIFLTNNNISVLIILRQEEEQIKVLLQLAILIFRCILW